MTVSVPLAASAAAVIASTVVAMMAVPVPMVVPVAAVTVPHAIVVVRRPLVHMFAVSSATPHNRRACGPACAVCAVCCRGCVVDVSQLLLFYIIHIPWYSQLSVTDFLIINGVALLTTPPPLISRYPADGSQLPCDRAD